MYIQTKNWEVVRENVKLTNIKESMEKISKQLEHRVTEINLDIMTTRNDPEVKELWNKLCVLHKRGLAYCQDNPGQDPAIVEFIYKPQTCINFLHLTEEETCCNRNLNQLKNS